MAKFINILLLTLIGITLVISQADPDDCRELEDPADGKKYGFCSRYLRSSDRESRAAVERCALELAPLLEKVGDVRRPTKSEPVNPPANLRAEPYVTLCNETCADYCPIMVYVEPEGWVEVIQNSHLNQCLTRCRCHQTSCAATYPRYASYRGRCVKEIVWVKLAVIVNKQCTFRYVKSEKGCCCLPYRPAFL